MAHEKSSELRGLIFVGQSCFSFIFICVHPYYSEYGSGSTKLLNTGVSQILADFTISVSGSSCYCFIRVLFALRFLSTSCHPLMLSCL